MIKRWTLACRAIAHRPGFAAAVVLILALGIGANTAMFSIVNTVLLKPLPFPHADRLVTVLEASPSKSEKASLIAPARLADWNRLNRTFEIIGASYSENVTDTSGSEPERLAARRVSPRYFDVFEMKPLAGRTFNAQEDAEGGPTSAVISYGFWTTRYHQAPDVVGRRLVFGGKGYTIIGVMPAAFAPSTIDLWVPAQVNAWLMRVRDARFYSGTGRLKPGVSISQAQQDLARIQDELGRQFPQTDKDWSAVVGDFKERRVGEYRRALFFAFGAVALLMLITLANIAGLTLTLLHRRAKELAIRSSIGGTRWQVIGAVTRELVVLSALGTALGCAAALWLLSFASKLFTELPTPEGFHLDSEALAFAALSGAVASILCGVLPALRATSADLAATLAQGGRGGSGDRHKWQWALAAVQVAITLVLLSSAALMLRSYYNLSHVDLGFDASHTLTFHVGAGWDEDRKRIGEIQEQLLAKLESSPGVDAAGFSNFLPATGATLRYQVVLDGIANNEDGGKITVGERSIGGNYVKAMGASMVAGISCPDLQTVASGKPKALVSRTFAERYGKGQSLVGRHFTWAGELSTMGATEIIGVVGNLREDTLSVDPAPYVYICFAPGGWPDPEYVVRTQGDARALIKSIRPLVRSVDSTRAVFGLRMVGDVVNQDLEQPRLDMQMITGFALAAMVLASVGLYSLVTLLVTSRTREIGVRMTLGAQPAQIVAQIIGGVGRLVGVGLAVGLFLTWIADTVLRSLLFGVGTMDPLSIIGAAVALSLGALLAVLGPARRATRIDPMEAMRSE